MNFSDKIDKIETDKTEKVLAIKKRTAKNIKKIESLINENHSDLVRMTDACDTFGLNTCFSLDIEKTLQLPSQVVLGADNGSLFFYIQIRDKKADIQVPVDNSEKSFLEVLVDLESDTISFNQDFRLRDAEALNLIADNLDMELGKDKFIETLKETVERETRTIKLISRDTGKFCDFE